MRPDDDDVMLINRKGTSPLVEDGGEVEDRLVRR